jgi:uncharacterized protein
MITQYIIDGYNLIHRVDVLRARLNKSLESARLFLITKLSEHQIIHHIKISVVFDSKEGPVLNPVFKTNIDVIYSKPPSNADQVIKNIIDKNKNRHDLLIVSSDQEVMFYAKASGCRFISSENFYATVNDKNKMKKSENLEEKSNPQMSKKEIAQWMDLFRNPEEKKE